MGLLPALLQQGYVMQGLRMLGGHGRVVASLDVSTFRSLLKDRYVSIAEVTSPRPLIVPARTCQPGSANPL